MSILDITSTDSDSQENSNGQDPISKLDTFLKENQHIFVLIGVFGTVSVYLSNMDFEQPNYELPLTDLSMFSGLGMVFILCIIVLYKLAVATIFHDEPTLTIDNIPLLVFGVLFVHFISVIYALLTDYQNVLAFFLFMVSFTIGLVSPVFCYIKLDDLEVHAYFRLAEPTFLFFYSGVLFYSLSWINYIWPAEYSITSITESGLGTAPESYPIAALNVLVLFAAASAALLFLLSIVVLLVYLLKGVHNRALAILNRLK